MNREDIILQYIDAYNQFQIEKMVRDFDEMIVFENISNGVTNMSLTGIKAFKEQAELAKDYFSERKQTVKSITHRKDESEVDIDYYAVLAIDLPNGLKKGEALNLQGKSIFKFADNKIIVLTDIS